MTRAFSVPGGHTVGRARSGARNVLLVGGLLGALTGGLAGAGCGPACREIEVQPLSFACEDNAQFRGEIHLDSRAAYETFLRDQCTPTSSNAEVENRLDEVDFDTEAVFAATRARDEQLRCIEDREVERVEVCETGLRITFIDVATDSEQCPGRWTVAFALLRDDLRTAIAED